MICDIRLPKLDGLTLFRRARQESPDTMVILMTAYAAISDAVAAVKEGAHDYLTKPFDIDEIALRMQAHRRATGRCSASWSGARSQLAAPRRRARRSSGGRRRCAAARAGQHHRPQRRARC